MTSEAQMNAVPADIDPQNASKLIAFIESTDSTIAVRRIYVAITGDFKAGCLLSQIAYWWKVGKNGKSKLRVKRNGRFWIAKRRKDWEIEIGLSTKESARAISILKALNLIDVQIYKFGGTPMQHIWLNVHNLEIAHSAWST